MKRASGWLRQIQCYILATILLAATKTLAQSTIQIQCPGNISVNSCTNIQEFYTPTVTDNGCGTNWTLVCFPPSGSYFAPGITTVSCTATDTCGASASCSFNVAVLYATNTCGTNCLQVSGPGNITATTCSNCAIVYFGADVSDCCTNGVTTTYDPPSGSCFPLGVTPLQVTTVDSCGNSNYCSFYVTVTQENTNVPVITAYPPVVYICEANGCGAMPDYTPLVQAGGAIITQSITPGTIVCSDTVVTFSAANACGYATNVTVPVVLQNCTTNTSCCGSNLGPQTIQWLPLPLATNAPTSQVLGDGNTCETWLVTNLPCYGRVLITETFPGSVSDYSNPGFEYAPNPGGHFVNVEPGYGPYDWANCPDLNILAVSAVNYTVNFYFLDGQPNPCSLWLDVSGLGENTTATASQPVVFRGEYDLLYDLNGSAHTSIGGVTNAGTVGTVIGSYYNVDTYGDPVNTGAGLFQPTGQLQTTALPQGAYASCPGYPAAATVPYLSLNVTQEYGDGIGFDIGNVCCSAVTNCCLMVSNPPSDIIISSCYPTTVSYPTPLVTDDCCSNVSITYNPPSSINIGNIHAIRLFGFGNTPVQCIVSDSCGNTNIYNFSVEIVYPGANVCNPWFVSPLTNPFTLGTGPAVGSGTAVFWIPTGANSILESTSNLDNPNWTPVTNYVPLNGAVVPNDAPAQFYRLYTPTN